MKKNVGYYESGTEHGYSLSVCMCAEYPEALEEYEIQTEIYG